MNMSNDKWSVFVNYKYKKRCIERKETQFNSSNTPRYNCMIILLLQFFKTFFFYFLIAHPIVLFTIVILSLYSQMGSEVEFCNIYFSLLYSSLLLFDICHYANVFFSYWHLLCLGPLLLLQLYFLYFSISFPGCHLCHIVGYLLF